jgi:hypothetical protein
MGELYRRPIDEIEHAPIAILSILRFTDYGDERIEYIKINIQ